MTHEEIIAKVLNSEMTLKAALESVTGPKPESKVHDESGVVYNSFSNEKEAVTSIYNPKGRTILKLVGQMPEPKRMKKVAVFVYTDRVSTFRLCSMLMTEEQAKSWCKDAGFNLVKWPYGDAFEVEDL